MERIKEKEWKKAMDLVTFEPPDYNYNYYNPFPVKPGIHFYKALVQ